ncbi:hypothetical protein [Kordiimonas sp.]|uniref:hypothetical protein n=1 Tax=Kordiimonas sp. TaxID=1970157 RepID=UPI003A958134
MFRFILFAALAAACFTARAPLHADTAVIRHVWTVDTGLFEPESVAIDEEQGAIYVSNVVGYGKNGKGYISKLSMSGRMIAEKWIEGLDAPTGMVLRGEELYFADFNMLKVADVRTGEIIHEYPAPDVRPCFNDVAIATDGAVYISASCSQKIYTLRDGALTALIEDDNALKFVNGLYVANNMLLSGGWQIWIWDRNTGEPLADGPVTQQANVKDVDGVAWDGEAFILSMVDDTRLWRLGADGVAAPISDEAFHAVDFQYDFVTGLLVMPRIIGEDDHRVSAYRLTFQ